MTTAVMMNFGAGSPSWKAEMYEALGSAEHSYATATRTTISSGLKKLELAWDLRTLSTKLSRFLDGLYEAMNSADQGTSKVEPTTPEQIDQTIRSMEYLYYTLNRICSTAKQKGLTNHSLMAGSLLAIGRRSEELLDFADWLHACVTTPTDTLDEIYRSGREELAKGDVYDLASVG